jgi:hypothetical protein
MPTDAEAEALIHDLRARGYHIEAVVEQEAVGRLATVLNVARPRHLMALKVLSRDDVQRPQDPRRHHRDRHLHDDRGNDPPYDGWIHLEGRGRGQ